MTEKPLILVVDDEEDIANNLAEIIQVSELYDAQVSYSALEAEKLLEKNKSFLGLGKNKVRLIISDIKMPGMSGLQFLEKVRLEYPNIGFIFLTAYEDKEKWAKARKGLVAAYVKKPFRGDDLLAVIKRFFAGKEDWMVEQTKWELLEKEGKDSTDE
ncbi:MAG: response regulator [Candidatus Saganbacteria bacterium]|nr:response regulator [Candidatus Saganbacteria bacterium]